MISLFPFKETHVFTYYASSTLFLWAVGTRHNNKVGDLYLRECFLEGNYRVLSGVMLFFENCVFAITRVAPTDPRMFQGVKTFPSQSVTGNGNAKMHSFLSQRYFGGSHFSSFGKSIESMCQKKVDAVQNRHFFEPKN